MSHFKEDILSEFKSKINEAVSLVSKIPVEQKAEVWNFWELITITVKLFTQVYVEDHVSIDTRRSHEVTIEESDHIEDTSENKSKTFQKNRGRLKKQSINASKVENNRHDRVDNKYESDEKNTIDKYEAHSDSDNDSVRHDVKTIDFTDLISYPSSVDTVVQHDETASMTGMQSCSTPSTTIVPHSDDINTSPETIILKVPQPDNSSASVDIEGNNDSSGSSQVNKTFNSTVTMHLKILENTEELSETETATSVIDGNSSTLNRETRENSLDSSTTENSLHKNDSFILETESSSSEGGLSVSGSDPIDTNKNNDQVVKIVHAEIIQTDVVKSRDKENKVPPLTLRKARKMSKDEDMYITCEDIDSDQGVRYLNKKTEQPVTYLDRRSCRQKRKVQHEEYVYEVAVERKKKREIQKKEDPFRCDVCGRKMSNLTALKAHSRHHSGQRPYACTICGRTFSTNGNRLRHEKSHAGDKEFQCIECNKWFTSATNLEVHRRVHTGEKPFMCELCDKRFTQQGSLKAHLDLHKGEKNYLCTVCGRAFTQKTNLESHLLRHNKSNRSYKCPNCSYSFFTKGELERHSFKHTKEKPYLCDYCPKSFTRSQYLNDHKILHVNPTPYSCKKCEETFADLSSLRKHKQWHRVIESQEQEGEVTDEQGEITDDQEEIQESIQQTCIVTRDISGRKQIIMSTDTDLPADVLQQFVDGGHLESEVTHIVPIIDKDGSITHVDSLDEGSQDIYQITFLDANSDSEHSNIIAAVDFSAMNLLANATANQFS
ncbi:Hypothetical predicted protein [Mytilus galloprovincialis]|uniref:C2H2-type domain-containing protein n=1 Tax=Mytilus galloprovincialis TaxID=29158 RepID=A0A8B6HCJ8_MYTGA|nr:Hypothetical predicted protein [Mytilus galloprovincialis]